MKRLSIFIIICVMILTLQGCKFKNEYNTFPEGVYISLDAELVEHMLYPDSLPQLHFDMENVNVSTSSTNASKIFVGNDFYKISDKWAEHLNRYDEDEFIIINAAEQTNDTGEAKFGSEYLKLDSVDEKGEPQECSIEYRAVGTDKDGTRYSYQYRSFVSEGKRYYVYCYSTSLSITIEQSLMVINVGGENKLLLVPLPFDTKYEVSGSTLTVSALIEKDTYLGSRYRKYLYPNSLSSLSDSEKEAKVRDWYIEYCDGETIDNEFIIKYAGAKFKVNFDTTRQDNNTGKDAKAFELIYIGPDE